MVDAEKKILFVFKTPPYGTSLSQEGLESVLVGGAFGQYVSVLFLGDGVYQLKKEQSPQGIGKSDYTSIYPILEDYEITNIYIDQQSLDERELYLDHLCLAPTSCEKKFGNVFIIERPILAEVMHQHQFIFNF